MEICISRAGKLICNLINETIGGHVKVIIHHVVIFATYMNNLNSARRPPFYLIVFFCEKKKSLSIVIYISFLFIFDHFLLRKNRRLIVDSILRVKIWGKFS